MSIKLKAFGLGLLAVFAMSAMAVMNASANTGGHFISEEAHTILHGEEKEEHKFLYGGRTVTCEETTFTGTTDQETETEITITPHYDDCFSNAITPAHVRMNGCNYLFTVGPDPANEHNTVHLVCPTKPVEVEVTIPFLADCTLTIKGQTPQGGVVYETGGTSPHDITADITALGIHVVRHGNSICGAATGETGELTGTATLEGADTEGNPVSITATGIG